jgi:hypothetical protein
MRVVRCLTQGATPRELARGSAWRSMVGPPGGVSMRNKLKFYFNLAIIGFTVGRAYGALRRRLARDLAARRGVWS